MPKKSAQGFISLVTILIGIGFIAAIGGALYLFYPKIPFLQKLITGIDKTDPDWKMVYCSKEIAKLPGPPFTHRQKNGINRTGPTSYLRKMMPEELKYSDITTCSFSYDYEEKEAWPSVGVEYKLHIDNANVFDEAASALYTNSVGKGWKLLSKIPKEDSGAPFYVTDAFPLVFRRENRGLGTVEYLDVFPAVEFYVKLSVYEK